MTHMLSISSSPQEEGEQDSYLLRLSPEERQLAMSIMGPSEDEEGAVNASAFKQLLLEKQLHPVIIREIPAGLHEKRYRVDVKNLTYFTVCFQRSRRSRTFLMALQVDMGSETFYQSIDVREGITDQGKLDAGIAQLVHEFLYELEAIRGVRLQSVKLIASTETELE